jgi:transketolase
VPPEVAEHMDQKARGAQLEREWRATFDAWSDAFPADRARWDAAWAGTIGSWTPPTFAPGEELATRAAGKTVMQAFKSAVPTMIGGAADLVESTYTEFVGGGLFSRDWAGRNIAFGIREHAMGSIVNGIGVHGGCVKPYGSTFLIFSDYMRPAVRLSALMRLPVVWAWTHDSVGLGEDGPTHQPVETYAALRAIPYLWFIRPADANETAVAWKVALERRDGPVALSLSRQKVPTLDRSEVASASGLERGAYTLWESSPSPELILISTGAEVAVTLAAGRQLAADGTAVRVVSMPCWELFDEQSDEYRDEVLPPEVKARLSVEPGVALGWKRWVGDSGDSISIEHFGASAPGGTVLEQFGYNLDNVVARAAALLERVA